MSDDRDDFGCCGGNDETPRDHCMDCHRRLHWDGDTHLANADGQTVAHLWQYKNDWEWVVLKNIDPKDNTRGTCKSLSAARKAIERAVQTFGYFITKE